ncbi:MAG: T9SS type A sorting domain-containing protein [Chitinophagaceae bacterium]|jgi:hypothetical protein
MKKNILFFTFLLQSLCLQAATQKFDWALLMEGPGRSACMATAIDKAGNIYTTGYFQDHVDADLGSGSRILSVATGGYNVFISKSDSNGKLIWAQQIGNFKSINSRSISLDSDDGDIYITGSFTDLVDFDPGPGVANLAPAGLENTYILKLDNGGNYIWAKCITSPDRNNGYKVLANESKGVFLTGVFQTTTDFDPGPAMHTVKPKDLYPMTSDLYFLKLDEKGDFLWVQTFGGNGIDVGATLGKDKAGNIYLAGSFSDTVDFDAGSGVSTLIAQSGLEGFVLKTDYNGDFIWAKSFKSTSNSEVTDIKSDSNDNLVIIGFLQGKADFDPGPEESFLESSGNVDIFVAKLNVSGNLLWARSFGGMAINSLDAAYSVTTDLQNNVYVSGAHDYAIDFDPGPGVTLLTASGSVEVYLLKLDQKGDFVWAKNFPGAQSSIGYSINADSKGNIYTSGHFDGTGDFNTDAGILSLTTTPTYNNKMFLHKIASCQSDKDITASGSKLSAEAAGPIYSYQWVNCPAMTFVAGATAKTFTAVKSGSYAVIINNGRCADTSDCLSVIGTGIAESIPEKAFSVYPNPANGTVFIRADVDLMGASVRVCSVTGQEVLHYTLTDKLSSQSLSPGFYTITVTLNGEKITRKVIVF